MVQIHQEIAHESGIALGGIGTGSVEIRPDGLFHEWQISNTGPWSPNSPSQPAQTMRPEDLVFLIRTKSAGGGVVVRYLALAQRLHELYSFAWLKCVQGISFTGRFPLATLAYEDPDLPVAVEADVFSAFIPHDSRSSGTPGFYVAFRVRNTSADPVEVSLMGSIRNYAGIGQEARQPHNGLRVDGKTTTVVLGADGLARMHPSTGEIAFSATGPDVTHLTGAYSCERPGVLLFQNTRYGLKMCSYMRRFRDMGCLPNLAPETPPALPEGFSAADLSAQERTAVLNGLLQHPLFFDKFHRLKDALPKLGDDPDLLSEFLDDAAANLTELTHRGPWGDAALCSSLQLGAGEEADSLFALSWHFPNHINPNGPRLGHRYENWFSDAHDVNRHLVANYHDFRTRSLALPEALYSSSLPQEAADAVTSQLSTLVKCTWWTKPGHFGVWEGLGCCGFHTTDITYQGSFPIIALFPDLQKMQMVHGARFQRNDGRVHHFFTPDFDAVDNGFDRVDMNPQFVMLAARDYLWTADKEYLTKLWPHIIRAIQNSAELDADGDGLPDHGTKRNTYDVWDFDGCPSYIASLWLGSLKAAVRLAREMGEEDRALAWQQAYDRGAVSFEEKLWNGEYYVLWKDPGTGRSDESCMTDQISGDWFCGAMGWGPVCRPERIKKAIASIMHYNFRPDTGMINASYPPRAARHLATTANLQAEAVWTGIEYPIAALLIGNGMVEEGMEVIREIHRRYLRAGRFWNHVECGDHYYRAMASWTVLIALSGFRYDATTLSLALAPAILTEPFACPFVTPSGWGVCRQHDQGAQIEMVSGTLRLSRLILPRLPGKEALAVSLNGQPVKAALDADGGAFVFAQPVSLKEGDLLAVAVANA